VGFAALACLFEPRRQVGRGGSAARRRTWRRTGVRLGAPGADVGEEGAHVIATRGRSAVIAVGADPWRHGALLAARSHTARTRGREPGSPGRSRRRPDGDAGIARSGRSRHLCCNVAYRSEIAGRRSAVQVVTARKSARRRCRPPLGRAEPDACGPCRVVPRSGAVEDTQRAQRHVENVRPTDPTGSDLISPSVSSCRSVPAVASSSLVSVVTRGSAVAGAAPAQPVDRSRSRCVETSERSSRSFGHHCDTLAMLSTGQPGAPPGTHRRPTPRSTARPSGGDPVRCPLWQTCCSNASTGRPTFARQSCSVPRAGQSPGACC